MSTESLECKSLYLLKKEMQGLQKFSDLFKLAKERVQEVYFEDLYGKQTRPVAH